MSHETALSKNDPDTDRDADQLMQLLALLLEGHRRLHTCLKDKRQAIRRADIDAIARLCEEERKLLQQLAPVEQRRQALVAQIAGRLELPSQPLPDLRALAAQIGEPRRQALIEIADALRALIESVRRESSIVATAADALNRHVAGVMQTVHRAVSRIGVYERKGHIAVGSQVDFCVDVKT